MARSENNWSALLKSEGPEVVARLKAEEAGKPVPVAGSDDYDRLQKLAEILGVPEVTKKRLADLKAATDAANAAAAAAQARKLQADKAVAEAERKVKEHEQKIAAELEAHQVALGKERDVIASDHAALAVQWEEVAKAQAALRQKAEATQRALREAAA